MRATTIALLLNIAGYYHSPILNLNCKELGELDPISRLYLPDISRPYLAYISPISPYLSRQEAPLSMKQSRWPLAYAMRAGRCEAGVAPMRLAWSGEI